VFGIKPLVGLSTLPLSTEILNSLSKENQLNDVFENMKGSMLRPQKGNVKLTEEAQSLVDSITSNLEHSRKKKRKASTEDLQASRQAKRSLSSALATTILHQSPTKSTTAHSPPKLSATSHAKTPQKGKSGGDDNYIDEWTQLLQNRNNSVTLDEMMKSSFHGGKSKFPIIYCINNKDINNPDSWDAAILRKVGRSTFEILDRILTDKVEGDDLEWHGDEGLFVNWDLYYKYPTDSFIAQQQKQANHVIELEEVEVSPNRKSARHIATSNVQKKADKVRAVALKKSPTDPFQNRRCVSSTSR
jgi:hypothetical protein